jgi:hypothetical protein
MFLVHPTPAMYLLLDSFFLFNGEPPEDYPHLEKCLLVSVKARTGYDLEFQVLTERGMLRDKLPIMALYKEEPSTYLYCQEDLQRWCCPSQYLTVVQLPLQTGKAWIGGKSIVFDYLFTVDFCSGLELDPGCDTDIPEEHKAMHVIALQTGQLAAMPNNSLVWDHPTIVRKDLQLTKNLGYKVQEQSYSVERYKTAKSAIVRNEQNYDT